LIRLTCKVTRCTGTLSIQPTKLGTRLHHAKATRPTHFKLRAGVARLKNGTTVKRLVTLATH
jgi:hypothetical protein